MMQQSAQECSWELRARWIRSFLLRGGPLSASLTWQEMTWQHSMLPGMRSRMRELCQQRGGLLARCYRGSSLLPIVLGGRRVLRRSSSRLLRCRGWQEGALC